MKIVTIGRHAASTVAGAAMLSACRGSPTPFTAPAEVMKPSGTHTETFKYTGSRQHFTVPIGVTQITVEASGAGTPSFSDGPSGPTSVGAKGGYVKATIPVTSGEQLAVVVGGEGGISEAGAGGAAGYNGGGVGGPGNYNSRYSNGGSGGGGASDIREGGIRVRDRVIIAGGAGGGGVGVGFYGAGDGGRGGGLVGGPGSGPCCGSAAGYGGLGGNQQHGGSGGVGGHHGGYPNGADGHPGRRGRGGRGGDGSLYAGGGGGAGGGGLYGGGGGGAGTRMTSGVGGGGGGGGGSSYAEPSAKQVKNIQGAGSSANGKIVISW